MHKLKVVLQQLMFWRKKKELSSDTIDPSYTTEHAQRIKELHAASYWVHVSTGAVVRVDEVRSDNLLRTSTFVDPTHPRKRYYNTRVFILSHAPI